MIKTFEVIVSVDKQYTGNGIHTNPNFLTEIDKKINDFFSQNLKIYKIDNYFTSFASKKQQFGSDERNTEITTYFIVSISYHEVQN